MASRISSRTYIGRVDEQQRLQAAFDVARQGGVSTVLVSGEAGVGKSRFVVQLREPAATSGALWATGECVVLGEGGLPYVPVASLVRDLTRQLDDAMLGDVLGRGAADLTTIVPGLADRLPGLSSPSGVEWIRPAVFEAVVACLESLGSRRPVVLVLEDLHWADPASLDLIGFLIRSRRRAGTLLAATYRSDELHRRHPLLPWLAEVARLDGLEQIDLTRLGRSEMVQQLEGILGTSPTDALVDQVVRRAEGNPFYVEELLASGVTGSEGVSPGLRAVLLGRLAALDDRTRRLVDGISVAAQPAVPDLLARVLGVGGQEVEADARVAIERHVLTVHDEATGALGFRHALVQEAVYGELLPGERRRLHLAFAAALERDGEPEPALRASWWAERAHHALAADDLRGGLVAALGAGRAAFEAGAFVAARQHLGRALGLLDAVPDAADWIDVDRVTLIGLAAEAAEFAADDARSIALRRAAVAALPAGAAPTMRARVLLDLSDNGAFDYEEALAATTEASVLLTGSPPSALLARATSAVARELSATQRWPEALVASERALEIALLVGDPSAEAVARIRVARAMAAVGHQAEGEAEAERALALARRTRDRSTVGLVFSLAARVHEGGGDAAGSARIHDEAAALAAELRIRISDVEIVRAWNHFQIGDWATTLAILAEHERLGTPYDGRFHLLSALVNARAGRREAAALHESQRAAKPEVSTEAVVRAECALWSDRPDDAAAYARVGLAAPDKPYAFETWKGWLYRALARAEADLAERARRRRRPEEAHGAARRADSAAADLVALAAGPLTYRERHGDELAGSVALARAEAARAAGRSEPDLWAAAADAWGTLGRPFEVAYARWREGEALLAAGGRRPEARGRLAEAAAIANRLGTDAIMRPVTSLAARARLSLADASVAAGNAAGAERAPIGSTLTRREREVLGLLCQGASNRQIAENLFITENTAGVHVSNILGKFDVASRTEAVAVATMAGLVSAAAPG